MGSLASGSVAVDVREMRKDTTAKNQLIYQLCVLVWFTVLNISTIESATRPSPPLWLTLWSSSEFTLDKRRETIRSWPNYPSYCLKWWKQRPDITEPHNVIDTTTHTWWNLQLSSTFLYQRYNQKRSVHVSSPEPKRIRSDIKTLN